MVPLYRRILGLAYDTLPGAVRRLHEAECETRWSGTCSVTRGQGWLIALLCAIANIPPETRAATPGFQLAVVPTPRGELWARGFASRAPFVSRQWDEDGLLCERINAMTMTFALDATRDGLRLILKRCHLLGIPLPRVLYPIISTLETETGGVFHFDVSAKLPTGHLIVHYRGALEPICT